MTHSALRAIPPQYPSNAPQNHQVTDAPPDILHINAVPIVPLVPPTAPNLGCFAETALVLTPLPLHCAKGPTKGVKDKCKEAAVPKHMLVVL